MHSKALSFVYSQWNSTRYFDWDCWLIFDEYYYQLQGKIMFLKVFVSHSVHNQPHGYSVTAYPCYSKVGTHPTAMLSYFVLDNRFLMDDVPICTKILFSNTKLNHWEYRWSLNFLTCEQTSHITNNAGFLQHISSVLSHLYHRQTKFGARLCFYSCVSFCSQGVGGGLPSMHHRSHDQGHLHPGGST